MSGDNLVYVSALRPFEGLEGYKDETSKPFQVTLQRFAELKANGLVASSNEPDDDAPAAQSDGIEEKKARDPRNKKAPEAENKAV